MRMQRAAAVAVCGLGLAVAMSGGPARAQTPSIGSLTPSMSGFQPMVKPDSTAPRSTGPSGDALPGARPGIGAAPADKSTADLAPNDALFDAINRGDIGEAHDAINRGAELSAENVLGMTPLELSVDLSRNDITFMLLSLRGASAGALSAKAAAVAAAGTKPAAAAKPAKLVKVADRPAATKPTIGATATPRQYAGSNDAGQPDPQSGFLGFGRSVQ